MKKLLISFAVLVLVLTISVVVFLGKDTKIKETAINNNEDYLIMHYIVGGGVFEIQTPENAKTLFDENFDGLVLRVYNNAGPTEGEYTADCLGNSETSEELF